MKLRNTLLTVFLLLVVAAGLFAQSAADTIPYRISYYELKKAQTVSSVAKSLKVDPVTIVKLNRLKSIEQELPKGRRLKVPLYGKGVVYISPSEKKANEKPVTKKEAPEKKPKDKKPQAAKNTSPNDLIIIEDVKAKEEKPAGKKQKTEKPQTAKSDAKKTTTSNVVIVEDVKPKEEKPKAKPQAAKPAKEKTETAKPPKEQPAPKKQPAEQAKPTPKEEKKTDASMATLAKEAEKEKAAALQQAREKLRQDSLNMIRQQQAAAALRAKQGIQANYDPEIDQNNLMLIDATLELNEAMLAGVKASLDTLNAPDPPIKNNNDVKEILQRMKRARDKLQLKPYLEYMNDSLSLDCNKLRTQREDVQSRLVPYLEYQKKLDSVATAKPEVETPVASAGKGAKKKDKKKPDTPVETTAKKDTEAQVPGIDTVIIVDLGKQVAAKPAKEKNAKPVAANTAKKDTVVKTADVTAEHKPEVDESRVIVEDVKEKGDKPVASQTNKPKTNTPADTITAVKEPVKQTKTQPTIAKGDTVTKTVKPVAATIKTDTVATAKAKDKKTEKTTKPEPVAVKKPEVVVIDNKPKTDTVAKPVAKTTVQKKDTIVKADTKQTAKTTTPPTANTTTGDTIQNIKSQFFLRRAQKAIAEKKTKLAEEYLLKSIELWRDNYEAWMTLADQDALYGSPVKALAEYQQCARIDSSQPKLFYKIASLHLVSKKKTEAIQYFTKTIAIDSAYLLAYMGRASVYGDYKQYDLALADYDKILRMNRSYHKAYKERGMIKQLTRNFSEAVDDFTRYLIFEDTDPSAYYYRGLAKIGNKELLEGCIDLEKSAEMGYDAAAKAMKKSCE